MSNNRIKIPIAQAKSKLEAQIHKAKELCENGNAIVKGIPSNRRERNRATDCFQAIVDQWQRFSFEILQEIFVSASYAYDFEKKKSSQTRLVSSSWKPDIRYYIEHVVVPKADYLNVLLQSIDQFIVVNGRSQSQAPALSDIDTSPKQSKSVWGLVFGFWRHHWKWIIATSIALIGLIWAIMNT